MFGLCKAEEKENGTNNQKHIAFSFLCEQYRIYS